jgi:hypothetical protein
MASDQTVLDYIARALWDPRPTKTDKQALQLAEALGYPTGWRVVRTLETVHAPEIAAAPENIMQASLADAVVSKPETVPVAKANNNTFSPRTDVAAAQVEAEPAAATNDASLNPETNTESSANQADAITNQSRMATESEAPASVSNVELNKEPSLPVHETQPPSIIEKQPNKPTTIREYPNCIVDRIYTGDPKEHCDMFYHHEAAMQAAKTWDEETSTLFDYNGGHLLPRLPLFQKGDKVQSLYSGEWWDATILRRVTSPQGFKYQVHYTADRSKQSNVLECNIRDRPASKDARLEASKLGLGDGWTAVMLDANRWKIVSPDGDVYTSKKKALEAYKLSMEKMGDPPWRTTDHEYLGRKVLWTMEHKVSARRTVQLEQVGRYKRNG